MARRKQEGNRFFRLDVDFFSDKKIKILKARYAMLRQFFRRTMR